AGRGRCSADARGDRVLGGGPQDRPPAGRPRTGAPRRAGAEPVLAPGRARGRCAAAARGRVWRVHRRRRDRRPAGGAGPSGWRLVTGRARSRPLQVPAPTLTEACAVPSTATAPATSPSTASSEP